MSLVHKTLYIKRLWLVQLLKHSVPRVYKFDSCTYCNSPIFRLQHVFSPVLVWFCFVFCGKQHLQAHRIGNNAFSKSSGILTKIKYADNMNDHWLGKWHCNHSEPHKSQTPHSIKVTSLRWEESAAAAFSEHSAASRNNAGSLTFSQIGKNTTPHLNYSWANGCKAIQLSLSCKIHTRVRTIWDSSLCKWFLNNTSLSFLSSLETYKEPIEVLNLRIDVIHVCLKWTNLG